MKLIDIVENKRPYWIVREICMYHHGGDYTAMLRFLESQLARPCSYINPAKRHVIERDGRIVRRILKKGEGDK